MAHYLVNQLRFTRSELVRCLNGISDDDARHRIMPMNCITWMIGHLAAQEQYLWVWMAQGKAIAPELYQIVGTGQPASTPPLQEMWAIWREITQVADPYLDTLDADNMLLHLEHEGERLEENIGTLLFRNMHHYWFHIGEAHAVRQQLGHKNLPEFVGNMAGAEYSG